MCAGVQSGNLLRTERRRTITVIGAAIGTLLAVLGMYEWLIPFLILLGTFIPPVGGVIMANYFVTWRGRYADLGSTALPAFNVIGLIAYALGSLVAYTSNWIAPVVGVLVAAASYALLALLVSAVKERRAALMSNL